MFKKIILIFCLLCDGVPVWAMGNVSSAISPLVGRKAPDAVLKNTMGISASINDWRQGGKTILVFWATWCTHCYEELGNINDQYETIRQKGVKIILVNLGESETDVKNYFARRHFKLISFLDENSTMQTTYHLIGVPTLIFIDEKGRIRRVTHEFPSDYPNSFH